MMMEDDGFEVVMSPMRLGDSESSEELVIENLVGSALVAFLTKVIAKKVGHLHLDLCYVNF